jgi:tetratricopeptide (TPR) repeat protein
LREYNGIDSEEGLQALAQVVREYYTPEEKVAFGNWLTKLPLQDKARFALTAGLQDVAVGLLNAKIVVEPNRANDSEGQQLIQIEQQRLMYAELAGYLEASAKAVPQGDPHIRLLTQAAEQWRLAVNPREELRVRQALFQRGSVPDPDRYAQLLFSVAPDRFVQAGAGGNTALRDATIALAYRSGDSATALKIIDLRGAKMPPVWSRAYTALTGVYFNNREPVTLTAFNAALGPRTIGEQIAARVNRDQQVVGDTWFYYGARYGEFTNSEDYLSAELEGRPASASPYVALGDYYRSMKADSKALDEYARALQLDPGAADVHNSIAEIYAAQKKPDQALEHWRHAIRIWAALQERRVPEKFWPGVASTIEHAGPALRPEIDKLLRTYIRRNGTYRLEPLLSAIWKASKTGADAARWVTELSGAAAEPSQFLASVVAEDMVEPAEREILFAKMLDLAQREAERRAGDARNDARWRLQDYQLRYLRALAGTKQYAKAADAIRGIPQDLRESMRAILIPIEIEIGAATGQLDSILQRQDIDLEQLKQAAASLRQSGDLASARRLLDTLYTRELDRNNLDSSIFLGLAEVKLEEDDVQGAVGLLQRMTIVATEPFETLRPAAELLARFKHRTEALPFWVIRTKAVPWDYDSRVQTANAQDDRATLRRLAADNQVHYASRLQAASLLAVSNATGLGSGELDLLASSAPVSPAAAEKPYYYAARLKVAERATDPAVRIQLLRGAIAIDPVPLAPRLQLFRTHFQESQFERALAVFRGQLPQEDSSERIAILRDIAAAYRKSGNLEQARQFLVRLGNIDPKQNVKAELASLDAELRRIQENQRRMPRVHDNLDQTERVRPRV